MLQNSIRGFLVLISLLAAFFLPKRSLIKYFPVSLFSTTTLLAEILFFSIYGLLKIKGGRKGLVSTALLFVFGPYFFSNLWVFHLSKGKFLLYSIINIIADFIYAFPIITLFRKLNFIKLKVSSSQFFSLILTNAFLNYAFQKFYERMTLKYNIDNNA